MGPDIYVDERATWGRLKPELLVQHPGKWALIKGTELAGVYDDETSAIVAGYAMWGVVPLYVKHVVPVEPRVFLPIIFWTPPCPS